MRKQVSDHIIRGERRRLQLPSEGGTVLLEGNAPPGQGLDVGPVLGRQAEVLEREVTQS